MKEELDQLESQKKDLESQLEKVKADSKHMIWLLNVDLTAVEKKIEGTKRQMNLPSLKRTSDPPPPATTSSPQIRTGVKQPD